MAAARHTEAAGCDIIITDDNNINVRRVKGVGDDPLSYSWALHNW